MYATVLIANFELQCAMRPEPELDATAVALLEESASSAAPVLRQINEPAHNTGVSVGMTVPQAQARCPSLVIKHGHPRQETIATNALLQAAERASPYLENTFPGCCTIDLRRQDKLDFAKWADGLLKELQALRLQARVGISTTPDAALQTAQIAQPFLIAKDSLRNISQLPILVLEPSPGVSEVLSDWGVQRVADLRALDRQQVAERLGVEGIALWDRAGGGEERPLRLVRAERKYEEAAEFEGGVETLEPLLFRLRRSLEQLKLRLQADLALVGSLEFTLDLDDHTVLSRNISIPAPTCEVDTLFRVMSTYLDTVRTESLVSGYRLRAQPSSPRDYQTHFWSGSLRDPNSFFETLARLSAIVGSDRVGVPARLMTHRPNQFKLNEPDFDSHSSSTESRSTDHPGGFLPLGLSLRRYRPPQRISVHQQGEQPARVLARELDERVKACAGPWQLDGDWWDDRTGWRWVEWDVELTGGGLYRLAQHRQDKWWLIGAYD